MKKIKEKRIIIDISSLHYDIENKTLKAVDLIRCLYHQGWKFKGDIRSVGLKDLVRPRGKTTVEKIISAEVDTILFELVAWVEVYQAEYPESIDFPSGVKLKANRFKRGVEFSNEEGPCLWLDHKRKGEGFFVSCYAEPLEGGKTRYMYGLTNEGEKIVALEYSESREFANSIAEAFNL